MTISKNIQLDLPLGIYERPKGNLYMLIKIEIWDEPKILLTLKKNFVRRMIVYGLILITMMKILNYQLDQIMGNTG